MIAMTSAFLREIGCSVKLFTMAAWIPRLKSDSLANRLGE
jgi:hypothetical protein